MINPVITNQFRICIALPMLLTTWFTHAQSLSNTLRNESPIEVQTLDTLYGSKRDVVTAKVLSIANGKVHVKRPSDRPGSTLVIPFTDVDAIRFPDGFRLNFRDGKLLRDNVLSAPFFEESLMRVKAEGVLALTREEMQSLYGPGYYNVVYRPYRVQTQVGIGKLCGSIVGCFYSFPQGRDAGYKNNTYTYTATVSYDPFWGPAAMFFMGTAFAGIVDCTISYFGYKQSLRKPVEERILPTVASSRRLLWGGVALSAAGIGGFAVSCAQLKAHPSRTVERPGKVDALSTGKPSPPWPVYALLGSTIVANLGFSAIQLGATRLSALNRLDGAPYALQVNVGPSPSGYGLTMRF